MLLLRSQLPLDALIRSLAPAAWFRQGAGITVTGSGVSQWDDQSGNGRHLLQGTDAARPIDLPFSGTRYLYLPGVAGNYASTPGSAFPASDIDVQVFVSLTDWTPSGDQNLVCKDDGASSRELLFYVEAASGGRLRLYTSANGTTLRSALSSAATGITDGAAQWVRVTRSASSGDVKFYLGGNAATPSWAQLGTTQSTTAEGIYDGSVPIRVGSNLAGGVSSPVSGRIYRAIIKNGIDGTTVVDFNPADADGDGDTSFASSTTGETWTINSSGGLPAQIVGRAAILFNGTSHYLKCNAFTLNQPTCVLMVVKQVSWTSGDRISDGNAFNTGVLYQTAASPQINSFAGTTTPFIASLAVGSVGVISALFSGASSYLKHNLNAASTANAGTNNMGGFTLGADGNNAQFSNIQVYEVLILPVAPSTAQLDRIISGLMARHGVA